MASVSGIYLILNTRSGKVYIGQSQDIRKRWSEHKRELNKGIHTNTHLQHAWNKYGAKAFKFKILERCEVVLLDSREQHFLDIYIPQGLCYNIALDAKSSQRGRPLSDEAKRKLSIAFKGRFVSEETRRKLSEATTGYKHNAETRQKLSVISKNRRRPPTSEETRRKISDSEKGKFVSADTRRKLSESHKGKTPSNKGKSPSDETRRKMSESAKKRHARKRVNADDDELARQYNSLLAQIGGGGSGDEAPGVVDTDGEP